MQRIVKYVKAMVVVSGALIAASVAAPQKAQANESFCTQLEEACQRDNGTTLLCVDATEIAECSGGVREHFDQACRDFAPSCHIVEVTDLIQACTCL